MTARTILVIREVMALANVLHQYLDRLQQLKTALLCEDLQAAAFRDYCSSRLSDAEYSAIYFAAEARSLEIRCAKKRKA